MVHIASNDSSGYYRWKSYSMNNLLTYSSWYKNNEDDTCNYIIKNLDIDPEYLEPNQ